MGLLEKLHITFEAYRKDESGATAIEYGLIAALIGVAMIVGARQVGLNTSNIFQCGANIMNENNNWLKGGSASTDGLGPCRQFEN